MRSRRGLPAASRRCHVHSGFIVGYGGASQSNVVPNLRHSFDQLVRKSVATAPPDQQRQTNKPATAAHNFLPVTVAHRQCIQIPNWSCNHTNVLVIIIVVVAVVAVVVVVVEVVVVVVEAVVVVVEVVVVEVVVEVVVVAVAVVVVVVDVVIVVGRSLFVWSFTVGGLWVHVRVGAANALTDGPQLLEFTRIPVT